MMAKHISRLLCGGLALAVCSSGLQADPTGGFIAILDEGASASSSSLDSLSSVLFYDVDDMSSPLFSVFLGFETAFNFEDPSAMAVDPATGDTYVLAFDSGTTGTDASEMDGGIDGNGDMDLYRIDFQSAYNHWAANFQGQGAGGSDIYVTYGRGANFDYRAVNPQSSGPFTFVEKVGEIARSAGDGSYQDPRLEFVDEDTLVFIDASTTNDGTAGTNKRVKAINRVSADPGFATWTAGSEEGGFNHTGTTESWESTLLGYLELDLDSRSEITDTAIVVNQDGVTGLWVVEADTSAAGAFGDDVAFFQIANFFGTSGNGLVEQNVGGGPTYSTDFQLDNNPTVNPLDNTGNADKIFVDPSNGMLIFVESGYLDADDPTDIDGDSDLNENGHVSFGAHEPNVFTREVLDLNNADGRIDFGAWSANIAMDTTGLTDDDTAEVITDSRMAVYDYVNNVIYFYDADNPTEGGSYDQDWYMLDLNTGVTSFIAQDVDNIISYSFGDDTIEYFCLGCSVVLDGDLNGDGFVGLDDLDIVLGNWNQNVTAGDWLQGDPSGDGFVGLDDLDFILGNWNAGTPPTASVVPEPASLALFTIAGLSALARRRSNA